MRRTSTSPCKSSVNDVVSDLRTETAALDLQMSVYIKAEYT